MQRRRHRASRGFTLIELLVGLAVAAVMMTAAVMAFIGQQRLFSEQGERRAAQRAARAAGAILTRQLSRAGHGVHPSIAFDFAWYGCAAGGACVRDRTDGPDEVVFLSRDPLYFAFPPSDPTVAQPTRGRAWTVVGADAGAPAITLAMHGGDRLVQGQVLQVLCLGGFTFAYVTVAETFPSGGPLPGARTEVTNQRVVLAPADVANPFQRTDLLDASCLGSGSARAFAVERRRFYIHWDTSDPRVTDPAGRPFLMLDTGTDVNLDGRITEADHLPVAADVEDLQVAYLVRGGEVVGDATSAPTFDLGSYRSHGIVCSDEIHDVSYRGMALIGCSSIDPRRRARNPGNVTGVRLNLVARTAKVARGSNGAARTAAGDAPPRLENHDPNLPADGYVREVFSTVVEMPNLITRGVPLL